MSVYRHRNAPCWQFDFIRDGHRFSGSTGIAKGRPKREAQERRAADRIIEEIRRAGREPLSFATAVEHWWSEVGQHGAEADLRKVLDWLKVQLGDRPLHLIGNSEISEAVTARRAHVRVNGHPIAPRTVNRTVPLLLRRIFRRARKNWDAIILREPDGSEHLLAEPRRPMRELSVAEEEAIAEVEGCYHALRRIALIMGLRKREALLTWPQIDFEQQLVRIVGKGKIPRTVPMTKEAYGILWAERGRDPVAVFTFVAEKTRRCPRSGRQYVKGQRYPITYWGLSTHRRRRWKKAGVDARFHDLRHTAGMRTLRATGNLKVTQRLLGHSDIATTSRFYVDALIDDVREAMERTATALESRKNSRNAPATTAKPRRSRKK